MKLQADYSSFETIGEQLFPKELSFDISADNNLHVELSLTKITINIPLVTPFRVPQSYHPVKVNPGTDN
jgi:hypothetical protein